MKDRDAYIVVAPTGKSKIYSVACRRVGSRDRFTVIATCQHEVTADSIVDGLKLLQGEAAKVDTGLQQVLDDVRSKLAVERDRAEKIAAERRDLQHKLAIAERLTRDANRERDAAQKTAREST